MKLKMKTLPVLIAGSVALLAASVGAIYAGSHAGLSARDAALVEEGRQVFRYDTFGDEIKWTDQLRMNEVISTAVSPVTALAVGLKVDVEALPESVKQGIVDGSIDLNDPGVTVALLGLDAVVGLKGTVEKVNGRSEEHTSALQSLMRISYAVFCLKKKIKHPDNIPRYN